MTVWRASNAEELAEAAGVLGDAWFDIDQVSYDPDTRTLTIAFAQEWEWGPMLEDPEWRDAPRPELVRTTWRGREERVPFMRGTFRIGAVESADINREAGDAGMLLNARYDATRRYVTVEGVSGDISAQVERVDVTAELTKEVAMFILRRHRRSGSTSEKPLSWPPR